MQGVWRGYGARVSGGTHVDAEWECSNGEKKLGSHRPWQGTKDVHDGFLTAGGQLEEILSRNLQEYPKLGITILAPN